MKRIKKVILTCPEKSDKFGYILHKILSIFAILAIVYYLLVGIFAGFGLSILYIWLMVAAGLIILDRFIVWHRIGLLKLPKPLICTFFAVAIPALSLFAVIECSVLTGFVSDAIPNADYIIVLGAKVNNSTPSMLLQSRIDAAYQYLSENPDTVCIASGGQGNDEIMSEASCIKIELIALGIDENRIILEEQSTSTSENLAFCDQLIDSEDATVVIVSNNFHIFRAKALARRVGIENIYGLSAKSVTLLLPHYILREFATIVVDTIEGNMKFG